MTSNATPHRQFDSIEAKTRWFRTLSVEERIEWLVREVEAALAADPGICERNLPEEVPGKVRILRLPQRDGSTGRR
jgi:hypothetical protein